MIKWLINLFKKPQEEFDEWYLDFVDPLPPGFVCPDTQPTIPGALETLPKELK